MVENEQTYKDTIFLLKIPSFLRDEFEEKRYLVDDVKRSI